MPETMNGPTRAYPGGDLYLLFTGVPDNSFANPADIDRIYYPPATLPKGCTATILGSNGAPSYLDGNLPWNVIQEAPRWIKLSFDASVALGRQVVQVPVYASTPAQRVAGDTVAPQVHAIEIDVVWVYCPPKALPKPRLNVKLWQQIMRKCADEFEPQALTASSDVDNWFYDCGRVYFQIEDYLEESNRYRAAALASLTGYKNFLEQQGGKAAGYYVFSRGFRMAFERTGDSQWSDAHTLLGNAPWVAQGGSPDPNYLRETAFAMNYWFDDYHYGRPRDPRLEQCANFLLGDLDMLFRQEQGKTTGPPWDTGLNRGYLPTLPYMAGLAFEPLIDWFNLTGDQRVIDTVRDACDKIWQRGVDQNNGSVVYELWNPAGDWYCSLNLLIAPAFAWLGHILGDRTMYQRGDFLFNHFNDLEGADFPYPEGMKRFSQNYRWSFDYFKYR